MSRIQWRSLAFGVGKWSLIVTVAALLALFAWEVFQDGKISDNLSRDAEKIVQIHQSKIHGYRDLKLAWEIEAGHIWTGRNRYLFHGEQVQNGSVFDSHSQQVIGGIVARNLQVNSRTRSVIVSDGVVAALLRRGQQTDEPIWIDAGELRYYEISRKAYLSNRVVLRNNSAQAIANDVVVDTEANVADIDGAFQVSANEFLVKSDQMRIFIDDNAAELIQNVKGFRAGNQIVNPKMDERERLLKRQDTILRADYLRYQELLGNKTVRIQGNVKLDQPDKSIWGDNAFYSKNDDEFTIEGRVRLTAADLKWAFRSTQLDNMQNKELKEIISQSLVITADKMTFYGGDNRSFRLVGHIVMTQPNKQLTCELCEYDDRSQKLTFSGGVRIAKNKTETLFANRLILDIKNETFSADGRIIGEFNIERSGTSKRSTNL